MILKNMPIMIWCRQSIKIKREKEKKKKRRLWHYLFPQFKSPQRRNWIGKVGQKEKRIIDKESGYEIWDGNKVIAKE